VEQGDILVVGGFDIKAVVESGKMLQPATQQVIQDGIAGVRCRCLTV
jgi:hypothetical protein